MAAPKKVIDRFANVAALNLYESATTTQTSAKFSFPFSIMDKMGLLISRIEYWWEGWGGLNSTTDRVIVALTAAAAVTNITNQADPLIIDSASFGRWDAGTPATAALLELPFVKDFSSLPGQGILVAPNPLYVMIQGIGTAAPMGVNVKIFYTYMELGTDEYWQLVESRRVISS